MNGGALATIGRGFGDPVHAAQATFRALLDAMSRPGRLGHPGVAALDGLQLPGVDRALLAVLMTLLDADARVWFSPALAATGLPDHLRFHTGVVQVPEAAAADFAVVTADEADPSLWAQLPPGTDDAPQDGATLMVALPGAGALAEGTAGAGLPLCLRGPGIADAHRLNVAALPRAFWDARAARAPALPCGVDLVLCAGDTLAALPRTTRLTYED